LSDFTFFFFSAFSDGGLSSGIFSSSWTFLKLSL
jgi:hypothetical protein